MRHRSRWCAAAAMVLWIGTAQAEGIALEELKARNAVQLDAAALKALMTGAKIRYMIPAGSTRAWSNDADGSFVASTDGRAAGVGIGSISGRGAWRVSDEGAYCVTIEWQGPRSQTTEKWCRRFYQLDGKYYGALTHATGSAEATEFSITH